MLKESAEYCVAFNVSSHLCVRQPQAEGPGSFGFILNPTKPCQHFVSFSFTFVSLSPS